MSPYGIPLAAESLLTALIVAAICALFFVTLLIASRITIVPEAEPEPVSRPARPEAPPVAKEVKMAKCQWIKFRKANRNSMEKCRNYPNSLRKAIKVK